VLAAEGVGPALWQSDRLVECNVGELAREATDRFGGDAAGLGDGVGCVFVCEIAFGEKVERGDGGAAVGEFVFADDERFDVRRRRVSKSIFQSVIPAKAGIQ